MRAALPFILLVPASSLLLLGCPAEIRNFGNGGDDTGGSGGSTSSSSSSGSTSSTSTSSTTSETTTTSSSTTTTPGMDLWVDPASGNDASPGDPNTPLKTLGKALGLIQPGYVIHILPGVLSPMTNGDVFSYTIPDGVHIDGAGKGVTMLDGLGASTGLTFAGTATIANLDMKGFGLAVRATTGQISMTTMFIGIPDGGRGISLDNTIDAKLNGVDLLGGSTGIELDTAAKLDMVGGLITGQGPNCAGGVTGIYAGGSASINLTSTMIQGIPGNAIEMRQAATAHLVMATIDGNGPQGCGNGEAIGLGDSSGLNADGTTFKNSAGPAILSYGSGQIQLTNCYVDSNGWSGVMSGNAQISINGGSFSNNMGAGIRLNGYATIDNATFSGNTSDAISVETGGSLRLRKSQLINNYAGISANTAGGTENVDLGMAGDPGNNVIQNMGLGLYVGWSVMKTLPAVGNTWVPGQQGTDATGHFPGAPLCGPFGNSGSVRNIRIINSGVCVNP